MIQKTKIPPDGDHPTFYRTVKVNDKLYKAIPEFESNDYDIDRKYGPFNLSVVFGDLLRVKYPVRKFLNADEKPLPWVTFDHAIPFLDDWVEHPLFTLTRVKDQLIQMVVRPIDKPVGWPQNGHPQAVETYSKEIWHTDDHHYVRIIRNGSWREIIRRECSQTGRLLETYCLKSSGVYGPRWGLTKEDAEQKLRNRKEGKHWKEC